MSLEKAVSSAYAAGCRLAFASGAELAAPEDMRVFRCADAHTAVYAALGASLAGRRALVALGEAVELPDEPRHGRRRRAHARRGRELCRPARGLRRLRERRRRQSPSPRTRTTPPRPIRRRRGGTTSSPSALSRRARGRRCAPAARTGACITPRPSSGCAR